MDLGEAGLLILWPVAVAMTAAIFGRRESWTYACVTAVAVVLPVLGGLVIRPSERSNDRVGALLPVVMIVSLPTLATFLAARLTKSGRRRGLVFVVALIGYVLTFVIALSLAEKMHLITPRGRTLPSGVIRVFSRAAK
jgi:hypothetical protein